MNLLPSPFPVPAAPSSPPWSVHTLPSTFHLCPLLSSSPSAPQPCISSTALHQLRNPASAPKASGFCYRLPGPLCPVTCCCRYVGLLPKMVPGTPEEQTLSMYPNVPPDSQHDGFSCTQHLKGALFINSQGNASETFSSGSLQAGALLCQREKRVRKMWARIPAPCPTAAVLPSSSHWIGYKRSLE